MPGRGKDRCQGLRLVISKRDEEASAVGAARAGESDSARPSVKSPSLRTRFERDRVRLGP